MKCLLTEKQAAKKLKLSVRTLQRMRKSGNCPRYVRIGRRILYRVFCIEKWLRENTFNSIAHEYSVC